MMGVDIDHLDKEPVVEVVSLYERVRSGEVEVDGEARVKLNTAMANIRAARMQRAEEEMKPIVRPIKKLAWHDFLERLIPYRDLILIASGLLAIVGVALVCVPAALVTAGVLLYCLARMMAK